jgi:hypothetical protein
MTWLRAGGRGYIGRRMAKEGWGLYSPPSMAGLISLHTHIALGVSGPHSGCHIFCGVYAGGEERFERRTYNIICNNHMAAS